MAAKGKTRMWWALAIAALIIVGGAITLQAAINRNGPAVLDSVDRITGGDDKISLLKSVSLGENAQHKVAVYGAESGNTPKPVIIFAHGGSWRSGSPDDYGFIARNLGSKGFVVVLSGYRLGENGNFPAMLEDTAEAVAWTQQNIAKFGGDPNGIFVSGHSAGAYNVVMVALDRQWLGRVGLEDNAISGVIGLAGPYDFYPFDSDSTRASFGGAPAPEDTQPINFVRGDAPPMLLMTGEKDTTVKPRNSRVLAQAITAAGGHAETEFFAEFDHAGILTAFASPWNRDPAALDRVVSFINTEMERKNAPQGQASVPVQGETG